MTGSTQVQQVRLLILAKDVQQQKKAAQFLTRRGWPTDAVGSVKQAVEFVVKYRPDFVLVSMSHPNPNVAKLPKLLAQTFNVRCIAFGESSDPKTLQRLNTCGLEHVFHGAVSGPTIHLKIKKIILEQDDSKNLGAAPQEGVTGVPKNRSAQPEKSNLASEMESENAHGKRTEDSPLAASAQSQMGASGQGNEDSYWSQAKKPVYGTNSDPEDVPYEKYKKPVYGKNDGSDTSNLESNRPQKSVAYMPEHQNADQADRTGAAYCPIPGDHSASLQAKSKNGSANSQPQPNSEFADSESALANSMASENSFQQAQMDSHLPPYEKPSEGVAAGEPNLAQSGSNNISEDNRNAGAGSIDSDTDSNGEKTVEESDFEKARKKNVEELKPHIDEITKSMASEFEEDSNNPNKSSDESLINESSSELSPQMNSPFQAARQSVEETLTPDQLEELKPQPEQSSDLDTAAKEALGESSVDNKQSSALAQTLAPDANLEELKAGPAPLSMESSDQAEEQKIMQLARDKNILAPDPDSIKKEVQKKGPPKQAAVAVLDLDDPFINPMDTFFNPDLEGMEVRTGAYYTVPPELFEQPDFALSYEGELPTQELNAANVNFRDGYNPDREMKAIASVVDDGFRDACVANENDAEEIQSLSTLGVITACSENRMGYILIARSDKYENDQNYLKEVKKSIENQKHLKEVELKVEKDFFITIKTVQFKEWAKRHAEFTTVLQHHDAEVAMAFVETKNLPIIKQSKKVENMAEVNVDSLIPDLAVNYQGYIKLEKNDKLILYIKNGRSISLKQKTRLLENNVNEIYIPNVDVEKFRGHYAESLLNSMIQKFKKTFESEEESTDIAS